MPDINIISVPSYQPLQPYYYQVDNLPINALVQRDEIINSAVDTNTAILESAIGNTGTLAARLDQSLEQNGNLKSSKINEALHNIGAHEDGMYDGTDYVRMELSEREKLALEALDHVGLANRVTHKPNELSGGQRQRVAVARALVNKPAIILADEPTGNLDSKKSNEIMGLFEEIHKNGNTIILVTHEEDIARYAHRIVRLKDGLVESDQLNPDFVTVLKN